MSKISSSAPISLSLSEVLNPKSWSFKESLQVERYLNQAVKQPCGICFLAGHVYKGIQLGNVNNMKMKARNISSSLNLAYSNVIEGY